MNFIKNILIKNVLLALTLLTQVTFPSASFRALSTTEDDIGQYLPTNVHPVSVIRTLAQNSTEEDREQYPPSFSSSNVHPVTVVRTPGQSSSSSDGSLHREILCSSSSSSQATPPSVSALKVASDKQCPIDGCDYSATSIAIHRHIQKIHQDLCSFPCGTCDKKFYSQAGLNLHSRKGHRNRKCPAEGCSTKTGFHHICRHIQIMHPDLCLFLCSSCDKRFYSQVGLNLHIHRLHLHETEENDSETSRKHSRPTENSEHLDHRTLKKSRTHKAACDTIEKSIPIICTLCNTSLPSKDALYKHRQKEHPGEGCFTCNLCNTRYHTKKALTQHRKKIHDQIS